MQSLVVATHSGPKNGNTSTSRIKKVGDEIELQTDIESENCKKKLG